MSTYTFLPYVRAGMVAAIDGAAATSRLAVTTIVNGERRPAVPLRLYGPGDIVAVDARIVVRTEPRAGVADFAPNYLPFIEFDGPDFPWLFSPADARTGPLAPWICLVVVPKDAVPPLDTSRRDAPPVLTCPVAELPDLSEAWAWAHAQALRLSGESIEQVLRAAAERNVSRLICPRRLEPNRAYYACVVPTFRAGAAAGLGEERAPDDRSPAWSLADASADVRLPVYYFWEFATAAAADFESLVRQLRTAVLAAGIGVRPMDLDRAAANFPDGGQIGLESALASPSLERAPWPDPDGRAFGTALARSLDVGSRPTDPPLLAPPIYGSIQAGAMAADADAPPWLRELNLDPRYRVAAALGVRVVQEQQEQLMASAWEQLGEVRRANHLLRHAQLARAVGEGIHTKRFARLEPSRALQLAGPVLTRVVRDGQTIARAVRESALPPVSLSPAFRRAARPHGPVAKRLGRKHRLGRLLDRLARRDISIDHAPAPRGLFTIDAALRDAAPRSGPRGPLALTELTAVALRRLPLPTEPATGRPTPGRAVASVDARFRDAAALHQDALIALDAVPRPGRLPLLNLGEHATTVVAQLRPSLTLPARIADRIRRPPGESPPADPLAPISGAPVFPQPMYAPLRDISREFILSGLDRVPRDTIAPIVINRRFVEAYMVGLNHEMTRELIWREFPADLRATYFSRFWELSAGAAESRDIIDIHRWTGSLGEHAAEAAGDVLVLLIRGDLVRRYPGAIIYMAKAVWSPSVPGRRLVGTEERHAVLRGGLDPDVLFVGFTLSVGAARGTRDPAGDAGWYLVIQEQPTEPRFGLDLPAAGPPAALGDWRDVTWGHVDTAGTPYLRLAGPLSGRTIGGVAWGSDAAHMARILLQPPVRLLIHADTLLGQPD